MLSPVFLRGAPGRPSWTARERASWPQLCAETGHRGPSPRQDMRFVLSPEEAPPERPAKSIRETPPKAPFPHPLTCSLLQGCSDHQRTQEATRAGARQGACRRGSEGANIHTSLPQPDTPLNALESGPPPGRSAPPDGCHVQFRGPRPSSHPLWAWSVSLPCSCSRWSPHNTVRVGKRNFCPQGTSTWPQAEGWSPGSLAPARPSPTPVSRGLPTRSTRPG